MERDYFELLGVGRAATDEELRAAFRKLARLFHPDAGSTCDPERFRRVRKAYEVLSDPKARRRYERRLDGVPVTVRIRSGAGWAPGGGFSRFQAAGARPGRPLNRQAPRRHLDLSGGSGSWGGGERSEEMADLLDLMWRLIRFE